MGALEWLRAFRELSTDRRIEYGMSDRPYIGPIPNSAIKAAAMEYGDEAEAFAICIRRMDAAYLEIVRENPDRPRVDMSRTFGPDMMRDLGKR